MTTFVVLRIDDEDEAATLLEDMQDYPEYPLLTPVQEHTIYARVEKVLPWHA
jgi:hypothetical protein